jgi:FixJ family two-component response regulator
LASLAYAFAIAKVTPQMERVSEVPVGNRPLVVIVDDDDSIRESLPDLVRQLGYAAKAFSSAEEFLASTYVDQARCLLLDVAMPGMSGPDLQQELEVCQKAIPIIFITANADPHVRSRLRERGAVDCLIKPFSDRGLADAISVALGS